MLIKYGEKPDGEAQRTHLDRASVREHIVESEDLQPECNGLFGVFDSINNNFKEVYFNLQFQIRLLLNSVELFVFLDVNTGSKHPF